MFSRILALIGLLAISSLAHAQSTFASFEWKRDSRFELQFYYNGAATSLKGNLLENSEVQVVDQGFTLFLKAFPEGFAYAVITQEFDDKGIVFLMERQNGFHVGMHRQAITGRKLTIANDIKGILEAVKKVNGWDVAIGMRSMVEYFQQNPAAQLSNYYDAVEAGQIKQVPRPNINPGVTDGGVVQMPETPVRPPKISVTPPVAPPVDNGGQSAQPGEPIDLLPPAEIPNGNGGGLTPPDMTQGWSNGGQQGGGQPAEPDWLRAERERQRLLREQQRRQPQQGGGGPLQTRDLDDDLF